MYICMSENGSVGCIYVRCIKNWKSILPRKSFRMLHSFLHLLSYKDCWDIFSLALQLHFLFACKRGKPKICIILMKVVSLQEEQSRVNRCVLFWGSTSTCYLLHTKGKSKYGSTLVFFIQTKVSIFLFPLLHLLMSIRKRRRDASIGKRWTQHWWMWKSYRVLQWKVKKTPNVCNCWEFRKC